MRNIKIRCAQALVVGLAMLFSATVANANLIVPTTNPTHPNPATAANGSSTLDPAPALYRTYGDCVWLISALSAQGYDAAHGWTINTATLDGGISLDTYRPWVNTEPAITQGVFTDVAIPNNNYGGATIGLHYDPSTDDMSNDPRGGAVHWVQVVHTTDASGYGTANGVQDGAYWNYIDNGYNYTQANNYTTVAPQNPFYDSGYWANSDDFVDVPSRLLSSMADWEAQVFIATWQPVDENDRTQGGTITLYDGVWWGFQVVPEPTTWVLGSIGGVFFLIVARRRKTSVAC